jgi:hypothetical protein
MVVAAFGCRVPHPTRASQLAYKVVAPLPRRVVRHSLARRRRQRMRVRVEAPSGPMTALGQPAIVGDPPTMPPLAGRSRAATPMFDTAA